MNLLCICKIDESILYPNRNPRSQTTPFCATYLPSPLLFFFPLSDHTIQVKMQVSREKLCRPPYRKGASEPPLGTVRDRACKAIYLFSLTVCDLVSNIIQIKKKNLLRPLSRTSPSYFFLR